MRAKLAVLTVAMLLILPAQAMAQGERTQGDIAGVVRDVDGAGLPGATVTLEGDNLIQVSVSKVSDVSGNFRFRNLRPGMYIVTVSLTGFQTIAYNVPVNVGTASTVIAELELAGVAETVTVVSETPLIDIESASLTTSYGADLLENVPVAREFANMTDFAAGFADKGAYGAGGNHSEGTSVHRQGAATNGYRLNGVDINELDWGLTFVNPNVETIAEIQIVGIGASAEYSHFTGAMVNIVTKGGTNAFHGSGSYYWQNGSLRTDNSRGIVDLERGKFSYDREVAASVGGPIARNKLLFFAGVSRQEKRDSIAADSFWENGGIAVDDAQQGNARWALHGKLDFLVNDTNTFGFMINQDPGGQSNIDLRPGSPLDVAMDTEYSSTTALFTWQSQLGDNTFTDLRLAYNRADFLRIPLVCCDIPDYWFNNSRRLTRGFVEDEDNASKNVTATVTQYVDDFLGAAHDVKVGIDYNDLWSTWIAKITGRGAMYAYGSGNVYGRISNRGLEARMLRHSAFIQDNATASDNLTLNLGLRFDRTTGYDMKGGVVGAQVDRYDNLAPRLGATLDVSGDGRAVFHGSWGRYFEKISIGHVSRATGGAFTDPYEPNQRFFFAIPDGMFPADYDPLNPTDVQVLALQDAVFQLANRTSFNADIFPITPGLKSTHTDVFNFGFEYELVRDWVVGLDYIRKDDKNMFIYNDIIDHVFTPFEYTSPVVPGFLDTPTTQTLYSKPSGAIENVFDNSDYYVRWHNIVTLSLDRRRTGSGLNFSTSLTYQNNEGRIENGDGQTIWGRGFDEEDNPNFNGHPFSESGPLRFSRTWSWKILGNYRLPGDILLGMYWNLASGRPWNLKVRHGSRGIPQLLNAAYGSTNIEKVRSRRWDSHKQLDLRLSKSFNFGNGRFELMVDGFNMLNDFSPTSVRDRIDRTFSLERDAEGNRLSSVGLPRDSTRLLPGRQFRLGARLSF